MLNRWNLAVRGADADVEPLGFGALRMYSRDGRVSFFPRAMATFHTRDGRTGIGWIEWNTNQRSEKS